MISRVEEWLEKVRKQTDADMLLVLETELHYLYIEPGVQWLTDIYPEGDTLVTYNELKAEYGGFVHLLTESEQAWVIQEVLVAHHDVLDNHPRSTW